MNHDEHASANLISRRGSLLTFFLLVVALSIPFWVAGASTRLELLPGLPLAALAFVCPAAAALIIVDRDDKTGGAAALLRRSFDFGRTKSKIWFAPVVLLIPAQSILWYGLMRLAEVQVPAPQLSVLSVLGLFAAFFVGALGEELGWSGYATDLMQVRWSTLETGVLLGIVWAAWHIVPLVEVRRPPAWIAWWCLYTVAMRVVMVWLYNNTGKSVFAAAVFHTTANLTWQLFPIHGSYYDPRIAALVMTLLAGIIAAVWGPPTLARRPG